MDVGFQADNGFIFRHVRLAVVNTLVFINAKILPEVQAQADFIYMLNETELTRGNLSSHLSKLEEAGYVQVEKSFRGKLPHTLYQITPQGQAAFDTYRRQLKDIVGRITG